MTYIRFLCLFLFSVWSTVINSRPIISNDIAQAFTALPVSYYSPSHIIVSTYPGPIQYVQFIQCNASRAGNPLILISIIQPTNVDFQNSYGFTVLEVSRCSNSFKPACIVATNYMYNSQNNVQAYNNITIPYNDSEPTLYFRLLSMFQANSISLHVSYVDDAPIFAGQFISTVFNNISPGYGWIYLDQMVKSDEIATVSTGFSVYYYVNFCEDAIITSDYETVVTVVGEPNQPLAAFDLAACAAAVVELQNCQIDSNGASGVATSQVVASTTTVELTSTQVSLSYGIYINVYGIGGELDGSNDFILSVIVNVI